MAAGGKRSSYTIFYKLKVVDYAKDHGCRAVASVFGPPPTEKNDTCLVTARRPTEVRNLICNSKIITE